MTVSSQTSSETFDGNGVTTIWPLPFRFFNNSDIHAYLVDPATQATTPLVLGTDYTLTGAGLPEQFGVSPGTIATIVPVPNLKQLYVERIMDVEQLTDIVNQGRFFPEVHEDVFDSLTMFIQQNSASLARALLRPAGKNYYDAQGRNISNMADPLLAQDAATMLWAQNYISGILQTGQGPINNAANVIFAPTGLGAVPTTVQAALDKFNQKQTGNFWSDFGGKANRVADRLFVGDAVAQDGNKFPSVRSWVGFEAGGFMTYFDSRSQAEFVNTEGGIGATFASRSSDNVQLGELNTIGAGSYVTNDNLNAADKKAAWAYYGHAVQKEPNEFTACMEVDICNSQAYVEVSPYQMGATGTTAAHWIGVGGETAQAGLSSQPASVAIAVISSAARNAVAGTGSLFGKGLVFQADALAGCDGINGQAIAIEMAKGQAINFLTPTNGNAGRIRSDNTATPNETRIIFANSGLRVVGMKPDLVTEQNLLNITTQPNAVNYAQMDAGNAGLPPTYGVNGTDANIDNRLGVKGTGVIRFGYNVANAAVPANFTAQQMLQVKDGTGTVYYIPCRAAVW